MVQTSNSHQRQQRWAEFRFSVIGGLLASPPKTSGELKGELQRLAKQSWIHPISGGPHTFSWHSGERWYYKARRAKESPVDALRRITSSQGGFGSKMCEQLRTEVLKLFEEYKHWSCQLHYDNLVALCKERPDLEPLPSYSTLRRYFKQHGYHRIKFKKKLNKAALALSGPKVTKREIRSFELEYVSGLWHADFHHGSLPILTSSGEWVKPVCLAISDDYSRLACHVQWYLSEKTEDFVHGFCQALQKRGLPRSFMTDNGSAMTSDEFTRGLSSLGIQHDTTLPYCPYQNGKIEKFWANLEGRLMAMLVGQGDLTLQDLNEATCAWVEMEYNQKVHDEIKSTPIERFANGPNVSRECPDSARLKEAFRIQVTRRIRRSDLTISIEGQRFEIPATYRCLETVSLQYARWDLSYVHLVDARTTQVLCRIFPLDKAKNADGLRTSIAHLEANPTQDVEFINKRPPLLEKLMADFAATGLPYPYLPKLNKEERK